MVKAGQPAFGTGIANGTELIIYLAINDDLLKKRTEARGVDFNEARLMESYIKESIEKSRLPVIELRVSD